VLPELERPEKARGFRRSLGAQEDGEGQQEQDRGQYRRRSSGASVHMGPSEIRYRSQGNRASFEKREEFRELLLCSLSSFL
jgi:hypothetical protein